MKSLNSYDRILNEIGEFTDAERSTLFMESIMTVRAPDELQKDLKKYALKHGLTRNALILQILWQWIKENDKD